MELTKDAGSWKPNTGRFPSSLARCTVSSTLEVVLL
uniref:Pdh1 n=1 Tax=Arundo donax TaxID=35708 RepID=A0A0A9E9B6_ARUDO